MTCKATRGKGKAVSLSEDEVVKGDEYNDAIKPEQFEGSP